MHKILLLVISLFLSVASANEPIYCNNYNDAILLAKTIDHNVLLIFSADWCINCQLLKKDLAQNSDLKNIIICVLDIDNNPEIATPFKIKKIPSSILLDGEGAKSKYIGYTTYKDYLFWVKNSGGL